MRIQKNDIVCGIQAEQLRRAFRAAAREGGAIGAEYLAWQLRIDETTANVLVTDLLNEGYLEPYQARRSGAIDDQQLTEKGGALANAKFGKGVKRSTADRIVQRLVPRIEEINASDDYLYVIRYVHLFGSYVTSDNDTLGDIDIAIDTVRKPILANAQAHEYAALHEEYARRRGQRKLDPIRLLFVEGDAPIKALKARSHAISMTTCDDGTFIRAFIEGKTRQLFRLPNCAPFDRYLKESLAQRPPFSQVIDLAPKRRRPEMTLKGWR